MTQQHIMEQLSMAYVNAIAAHAGYTLKQSAVDYGIDGTFADVEYDAQQNRHYETGFSIDFQAKATTNVSVRDGNVYYDLEVKNYRDLSRTTAGTPRILIVYEMPKSFDEWVSIRNDMLILKKCAWWCSLKGSPETQNSGTIRIHFPDTQRLSPQELTRLMNCVKEGAVL